jgi:hypothetical protein
MKSLTHFAPCGLTQLCIIACPNNRWLGLGPALECQGDAGLPDDKESWKVEFGDNPDRAGTEMPPQRN